LPESEALARVELADPCPRQIDPLRSNAARLKASTCSKLITRMWSYS